MHSFEKTKLWKRTLAPQRKDSFEKERSRLREAFFSARENVRLLVAEIQSDLPQYTVHDITHIDGLWEYADQIAGDKLTLTPAEAFVLGLSFLIHDAGMAVAAFPNRLSDIKALPLWADTLASKLSKAESPLDAASRLKLESETTEDVLRLQHALVATNLGIRSWSQKGIGEAHLLDDLSLRTAYGAIAGEVASSHWDSVSGVAQKLNREFGTPTVVPAEWSVDLLKVAFLLRAADAAQIDSRRAPHFLRMLRNLGAESDAHWMFQGIMNRPLLRDDRLVYTTTRSFSAVESDAWWLCNDTLKMIDRELRLIDSALADAHKEYRFAARGVANIEANALLIQYIPVKDWFPIDVSLRVGNIPQLVQKLGGAQLYGDEPLVALRELIQNSCDAVRARRALESRPKDWGDVSVSISKIGADTYIEVQDTGIGMSVETITQSLLDFGSSYWNSELSRRELPTLSSRGFKSTGKFGIGFFSAFMLGEDVSVFTKRPSAAADSTISLTFAGGVLKRPILSLGQVKGLNDSGTIVKIKLYDNIAERLLETNKDMTRPTFASRIVSMAPALDVNVNVKGKGGLKVKANSWMNCPAKEFVQRCLRDKYVGEEMDREKVENLIDLHSQNVRDVVSPSKKLLGRGFLDVREFKEYYDLNFGSAVVGGLSAGELNGFGGIFLADTELVTRQVSKLIGDVSEYHDWMKEQVDLLKAQGLTWEEGGRLADILLASGIEDETIPVILAHDGQISVSQFKSRVGAFSDIVVVQDASYRLLIRQLKDNEKIVGDIVLEPNVFISPMGVMGVSISNDHLGLDAWGRDDRFGLSVDVWIAKAAMSAWGVELTERMLRDQKRMEGIRANRLIGRVAGREIFDTCYGYAKPKTKVAKRPTAKSVK